MEVADQHKEGTGVGDNGKRADHERKVVHKSRLPGASLRGRN